MVSQELIKRLLSARRVVAMTGAGISAESGIPTFRAAGGGGLWDKYRPEELASPEGFARDPQLVWSWYQMRRRKVLEARPNAGHMALTQLDGMFETFTLVTQNVDGLHAAAGSKRLLELHGNIMRSHCHRCGRTHDGAELLMAERVPTCECGGLVRPSVVWFGEMLPGAVLEEAYRASREAEVFLSIGTSAVVYPAADLAHAAKRGGAWVVEVNPEPTPLTDEANEAYAGAAGTVLPEIVRALMAARAVETPGRAG